MNDRHNSTETEQEHTPHTASPLATRTIQFGDETPEYDGQNRALYIPPPWKRDRGKFEPGMIFDTRD
jgi:hypothetical protein